MARWINVQAAAVFFVQLLLSSTAFAHVLRVPDDHATIQEAVDAASAGDRIVVGPGDHCGAEITKRVVLVGHDQPTIIGCDTSPRVVGEARAGFLLSGSDGTSPASGTRIVGFTFDGLGVSNGNLQPLAYGIFARFAHDIGVVNNYFIGTVQAITNTAGDRWAIWQNRIEALSVFDCTGAFCSGGDGIVVQLARGSLQVAGGAANPANRPERNWISHNFISANIPSGFSAFSLVGILVLVADGTTIVENYVSIADNPLADAPGEGIVISNLCCGDLTPFLPGTRNTVIAYNDGRHSETAIIVEGSNGDNKSGLSLLRNRGKVVVEGSVQGGKPGHSQREDCVEPDRH